MPLLIKALIELVTSLFREAFAWRRKNPDSATTSKPTPEDTSRHSRLLSTLPHNQPPKPSKPQETNP